MILPGNPTREKRLDVQMVGTLKGKRWLLHLWKEQGGLCPICHQKITNITEWHSHHVLWRSKGGSDRAENRVLLHRTCHQQVHSQGLHVEKPRPVNGRNERLEPCAAKVACTVLRGGGDGNIVPLTRPFRRGRRFGTILVDVSNHQVIDLLNERSTKSAAEWMRRHPEIEYVSRDRGNDYAQAAREGAPQATPVADRFHLYKNLVEAIEPTVTRCYKEIRKELPPFPSPRVPKAKEWRPAPDPAHEHQHQSRLAKNQERFDSMIELQKLGVPQGEVARRLAVTTRTVQIWNKQGACPGHKRRRKRRSLFDPYAVYVLKRWREGCKKGSQLYLEMKEKGYRGTDRQVYRFLKTLKQEPVELPALPVLSRVSVREALWLIARPFDDLEPDERADLEELCQASTPLAILHMLVQSFGQIVRKREGHRLGDWKQQVAESGLAEVQRFAKGLERDKEAVLAGLTVVHSNAQAEGFVNKLKLIKRQGYGRASFPLLRQRVLHAL
jgi:transposase